MLDQIIVFIYLALSLAIGLFAGRNTISLEDYAIGKRDFSNFALAAGIAATMISASSTSGLVGKIYLFGAISVLSYFGTAVSRMLVAFVIAPRMENFLGLLSSGDIFEKLYGRRAKILMGFLTLIEGPLLAGAQVLATYQALQVFFDISKEAAAISTTVIIVIYCFRGGIRSVNATDVFQFLVIMVAIPTVAAFAIFKVGGLPQFITALTEKRMLVDSVIEGDQIKHLTIFISIAITCVFPLTLQRMLMAKNTKQIHRAFLINGVLTFFFNILMGIIGLAAIILIPQIDPNFALPGLVNEILPIGIKGLVIAGLVAIFMSSADSDMNITAVALTQDLFKPFFGHRISGKTAFNLTKMSVVFTGIFAVIVALYYTNALDMLFVIMTIANSIYFPGMFFGIMGAAPSKTGFWIGAIAGALVAAILCFGFHVFPLYAMMSAILVNSAAIILSNLVNYIEASKIQASRVLEWFSSTAKTKDSFFEFKRSNYSVSASSYYDIFATFVLIDSIVSFFLPTLYLHERPFIMAICGIIACILAVLLLLRKSLSAWAKKILPILWQVTIFISLTLNGAFYLTSYPLDLLSVFNTVITLSLLILLVDKQALIGQLCFWALALLAMYGGHFFDDQFSADMRNWSICLRTTALILCLILFRSREVAAYKFMSLKFVHEAGRTISSVSTSALLLKNWLPKLVDNYLQHDSHQDTNQQLTQLLEIPEQLTSSSVRTWDNLNQMAAWMEIKKRKNTFTLNSIKQSLNSALYDSSLNESVKNRITVKQTPDFKFYGDKMQIGNVILNLIENAGHAIKNRADASIEIWTKDTCLFIRDTGTGISKQNLPNIFDEFFSTKGTRGQGLAFCRLIMEQHNGSISCDSELGKYTQFTLSFPFTTGKQETVS